ncbi:hypothetical protein DV736_g4479, partial [Chaetothyriales sp. CBS 134916]
MASGADRGFKQDLVVSIRYRNDLPPPPMPPKLLDIDTGGIQQYLTTSYASSLARREMPNIDTDAEGGMAIDMVGVPGYFLGDESAITAPLHPPPVDPTDAPLLQTLHEIKSQGTRNNVSFLRKTQYMTSQNANTIAPLAGRAAARPRKRASLTSAAPSAVDREDKENIKRHVQKGFDIAYPESIPYNPPETRSHPATQQEREGWRNPKHPTNRHATAVSYHPIIPDLEAGTDLSAWCRFKFEKPPLAPNRAARDNRIDVGSFFTVPDKALEQAWLIKNEAWKKEPESYDDPGPQPHKFSLHIPRRPEDVPRIKKHLFTGHPRADDPELLAGLVEADDNAQGIPYDRARVYPTVEQTNMDSQRFMALGLYNKPSSTRSSSPPSAAKQAQGTAAYYYPINENVRLRADRKLADFGSEEAEDLADVIYVAPTEPTAQQIYNRHDFRGRYDRLFAHDFKKMADAVEEEEKRELEALEKERAELGEPDDMEGVQGTRPASQGGAEASSVNGHARHDSPLTADDDDDDMHDH